MIINRVGILSVAKILGAMYAFLGLIAGFFMFVIMALGSIVPQEGNNNMPVGIVIGLVALFAVPITYGIMGFVGGLISGAIYNMLASLVGGIEIEFAPQPGQPYAAGGYQA